ncbi:MAG: TetR family transcriptional regulator [Nakamurella sp.]
MRSKRGIATGDLTTRARIRDAAISRFATDGFGASLRVIAADAGVSPGLVIHHFGSKVGLRSVCDEQVLAAVREAKTATIVTAQPGILLAQLAAVEGYATIAGYLVQALQSGGDLAAAFMNRMTEDAQAYLAQATGAGRVRVSRDPASRARFLAYSGVGAFLVYVRQHMMLGDDMAEALHSYTEEMALPALELYTEGLFATADLLEDYLRGVPAAQGK